MCKFHQNVAREIATDPLSRKTDPVLYSIALVAMARYRVEQYMPSMSECDGNSAYLMASSTGVSALEKSGLPGRVSPDGGTDIAALRGAMQAATAGRGYTLQSLNLPADPLRDNPFLDEAAVDLYTGYTAPGYAALPLDLKDVAHKADFEPLRAAVERFFTEGGVTDALQRAFERSVLDIFQAAPAQVNPTLLRAYDKIPAGLRSVFKTCAMCAGSGTGGALVSHLGCIAVPVVAGATGTVVSTAAMTGMMLVGSPLIATAVTYGIDRWRGVKTSSLRLGGAAAIAFAVAAGVSTLGGHDAHTGHEGHERHDAAGAVLSEELCTSRPKNTLESVPSQILQ